MHRIGRFVFQRHMGPFCVQPRQLRRRFCRGSLTVLVFCIWSKDKNRNFLIPCSPFPGCVWAPRVRRVPTSRSVNPRTAATLLFDSKVWRLHFTRWSQDMLKIVPDPPSPKTTPTSSKTPWYAPSSTPSARSRWRTRPCSSSPGRPARS